MGVDAFVVNLETRELFTVRNFRYEEAFLASVTQDRDAMRAVIKQYQSRSDDTYVDWLTDRLWAFTRGGTIFIAHDNGDNYPYDAPFSFFNVHEAGFRDAGTMWDAEGIWWEVHGPGQQSDGGVRYMQRDMAQEVVAKSPGTWLVLATRRGSDITRTREGVPT
jgi:hypothetical protein